MQPDKVLHFAAGVLASLVPVIFMLLSGASPWWMPLVSSALFGAAKEVYDHAHPEKHTVDVFDFVATALGGLPVALTLWVAYGMPM